MKRQPLVQEQFQSIAREQPAVIAVSQGDKQWTYAALNAAANHLGRELARRGLGPGHSVAVSLEPSFEWIAAIIACWKVGAAYVPLDWAARPEQNAALIRDAGCSLLLATRAMNDAGCERLGVEELELQRARATADLPCRTEPSTLAYVIFTSGSTGKRKGVCVPHRGLANLARHCGEFHGVDQSSRYLQLNAQTFDASICEVIGALANGAALCLLEPGDLRLPSEEFKQLLERQAITHFIAPPSFLERLPIPTSGALQDVLSAGEACSVALAQRWSERNRFSNGYGPTEATVYATGSRWNGSDHVMSLGEPVANVQIHLLDGLDPVPPGVDGEIVIGGIGVADGYLALPGRTALTFVPDPFASVAGARMYRTGDFARRDEHGKLIFVGRRDREIKLRGVRMNLDEIETVLARCPAVRQLAVIARASDEGHFTQLGVYFVPSHAHAIAELRAYADAHLTKHQIPSLFVPLAALPVTKHGKVDRLALPALLAASCAGAPARSASALEERIGAVWRTVLGLPAIDAEQNFFDVGGNSLLLARLQQALRETLGAHVSVLDLFEHPTIAEQARHLGGHGHALPASAPDRPARPSGSALEVAIVGIAAKFPGANSALEFWRNLCEGRETLRDFTAAELREHGAPEAWIEHRDYVARGGVLEDADCFDAAFFGVSPEEARATDPQQRLLLEIAHAALEDAGYDAARYSGRIGVYAGAAENQYGLRHARPAHGDLETDLAAGLSGSVDFLATRVSYKLNLRGPSLTVQTACSTSLSAVVLACDALRAGRCEMALAGGVTLRVPQIAGYFHSDGVPVSRDGTCRPFDRSAAGTCFSSGVGMVVLKPLAAALADGDHVYAVVRGAAINNDGADKLGFSAPSATGQTAAIAEALAEAGVDAREIGYVEAHATGTALGDPIEVRALTAAFRRYTAAVGFCALGSVKANIGHTNRAAGVASLIKAALALQERQIPPLIRFEAPNPALELAESPFYVPTTLSRWNSESPRHAGVSSLGAGGTNVHLVLGEAPEHKPAASVRAAQLVVISGRSRQSLQRNVAALSSALGDLPDTALADAAFTLQVGRAAHEFRLAAVAAVGGDGAAIRRALLRAAARPVLPHRRNPRVCFLFPGHGGSRLTGLGRGLYASEPVFRKHVGRVAEILRPAIGLDLQDVLFAVTPEQNALPREQPKLLPLMLFALEYALAQQWRAWGIEPALALGHSAGEYAAACIAGVFVLEDALTALRWRTELIEQAAPGAMLAARMREQDAERELDADLSLAAINGADQCVFSGTAAAIAALEARLRERDVDYRVLETANRAGHSPLMEPLLDRFRAAISQLRLREPRIEYISNLDGSYVPSGVVSEPEYWVRQLRETVRFHASLRCALGDPTTAFVEVGPPGQLSRLVPRGGPHIVVSSLPTWVANATEVEHMLGSLGRLWTHGVAVDWQRFHAGDARSRISLPTYSFERERHWLEPAEPMQGSQPIAAEPASIRDQFHAPLWRPSPTPKPAVRQRRCLVFSDGSTLADAIVTQLGPDTEVVHPGADLERVRRQFSERHWHPDAVLYLWSCLSAADATQAIEAAFAQLIELIEELGRSDAPVDLTVVTRRARSVTGDEALCPESALAAGACAVATKYSHIRCKQIDLDTSTDGRLAEAIGAELAGDRSSALVPVVAYRRAARFVLDYQRIPLERPSQAALPIRDGGVYVVVGADQAMADAFARWLAPRARVVSIGAAHLEAAAAAVRHYASDPSDAAGMTATLARIRKELGPLTGAISCNWPLESNTAAALEKHLRATQVLAAVLEREPLEFVLWTGSLAPVLRTAGSPAEAAAGSYLDAFAHNLARASGVRHVSVAWDAPQPEAAERILASYPLRQVAVSAIDLPARIAEARRDQARPAPREVLREDVDTYVAPRNALEQRILQLWEDLLGARGVGVDDSFFEVGGDSLIATRLARRVRGEFDVELPLRVLFERPTVAGIAQAIEVAVRERPAAAEARPSMRLP